MTYLTAMVKVKSNVDIKRLGDLISTRLFGDIPFIRSDIDEMVSYCLERTVAGMTIRLSGYVPEYMFTADTDFIAMKIPVPDRYDLVSCSSYFAQLIQSIDHIDAEAV